MSCLVPRNLPFHGLKINPREGFDPDAVEFRVGRGEMGKSGPGRAGPGKWGEFIDRKQSQADGSNSQISNRLTQQPLTKFELTSDAAALSPTSKVE